MALTVETWCEALESGQYTQATGNLRVGEGYCCLGVACDLSGLGHWNGDRYAGDDFFSKTTDLPQPVQEMLGLSSITGLFSYDELPEALAAEVASFAQPETTYITLAELNDAGASFPLIAKVIRARPKGLFLEDAS